MAIAIMFMLQTQKEKQRIQEVAENYVSIRIALYEALAQEFWADLPDWGAEIDPEGLAVRFREPDVLFDLGDSSLKTRFKKILNDFFPRYVQILTDERFVHHIGDIRIEGHTSSDWRVGASEDESYLRNMRLSQDRTRAVLEYVLLMDEVLDKKSWLKSKITANGLSSSQLIFLDDVEDPIRSRRVEFKIRTDADEQLLRIIQISGK